MIEAGQKMRHEGEGRKRGRGGGSIRVMMGPGRHLRSGAQQKPIACRIMTMWTTSMKVAFPLDVVVGSIWISRNVCSRCSSACTRIEVHALSGDLWEGWGVWGEEEGGWGGGGEDSEEGRGGGKQRERQYALSK